MTKYKTQGMLLMENSFTLQVIDRFIDLIVRTIVPMSIIFIIFIIFDSITTHSVFQEKIYNLFLTKEKNINIGIFIIFSIGFGLIISIAHRMLDKFNTENFNLNSFLKNDSELTSLRQKVIDKLLDTETLNQLPTSTYRKEQLTDFKLYKILVTQNIANKSYIHKYNDQAKQLYTIYIGLIFNILFFLTIKPWILNEDNALFLFMFSIVLIIIVTVGAIYSARERYRARNIGLYLLYLLKA